MTSLLHEAFAHNAWANREMVAYLRRVDESVLNSTAVGTFGSILETLKHMVGAESHYRFIFTGDWFDWRWDDNAPATLDDIERWMNDLGGAWPAIIETVDAGETIRRLYPNGTVREVRASVVLAQVLHHGSVHREQISTILTHHGRTPPDLDLWVYAQKQGLDRYVQG